mmetsp:Transcript_19812/g.33286  ORF Transcript_19812/g.33286 Transcript_19812/m.33286 type:complete len:172 (+) Transcript_19812:116-631(+)|eukprot:CAMPEP_0198198492 /NCGR_PEP_ID=MMETSP1445-20131203/1967_1 /TAXON_ID=36898 /ORGANISM="Pyramimonas sp., Strain CCMP2087" /LENGTH=171 /DNA_ID=CAMNT_0043868077 /DNA_START=82 /DNA_END=597 /DNA_ORIENTATION=-
MAAMNAISLQAQLRAKTLPASKRTPTHSTRRTAPLRVVAEESMTDAYARIREQRKRSAAQRKLEDEGKGGLSLLGALDFQEDIKADRGLLSKAKKLKKGEKMSRESYNAVQRKVSGTSGGFFGEQVELKGKYADKGYVRGDGTSDSKIGSVIGAGIALAGVGATLFALSGM